MGLALATRLDRLAKALPGGGPPREPLLWWVIAPDAPEPPQWAADMIRDRALVLHAETVIVEVHPEDGISAHIGSDWFRVTPDGLDRIR